MFWAIAFLIAGIICGRIMRSNLHSLPFAKITFTAILALLFIMGAQLGKDPQIVDNLSTLGLRASLITGGAIIGTLLAAGILAKFLKINIAAKNIRKN